MCVAVGRLLRGIRTALLRTKCTTLLCGSITMSSGQACGASTWRTLASLLQMWLPSLVRSASQHTNLLAWPGTLHQVCWTKFMAADLCAGQLDSARATLSQMCSWRAPHKPFGSPFSRPQACMKRLPVQEHSGLSSKLVRDRLQAGDSQASCPCT